MARTLTASEHAILAHVVKDAQGWFDDAVATYGETLGETHLAAKLANPKHVASYHAAVAAEGPSPKTRAQRHAEARAAPLAAAQARPRPARVSDLLDLLDAHGTPAMKGAVAALRAR